MIIENLLCVLDIILVTVGLQQLLKAFRVQLFLTLPQWHHIVSLKSAIQGMPTPKELANAANQSMCVCDLFCFVLGERG